MWPQLALAWTGTTIPEPLTVALVLRAARIARVLPAVSASPTEINPTLVPALMATTRSLGSRNVSSAQ